MNRFTKNLKVGPGWLAVLSGVVGVTTTMASEVSTFGVDALRSVDSDSTFPRFDHAGLHYKMFDVHAGLSVAGIYDDNLNFGNSTNSLSDFHLAVSPLLSISASDNLQGVKGKSVSLTYIPTFEKYLSYASADALDQSVNFEALLPFSRLRLGVAESFTDATAPAVDLQRRLRTKNYNTSLSSHYTLSEKTSFEVNGNYNLSENEGFLGTESYQNQNWFNYNITPKTTASLGVGFGLSKTDAGDDQRSIALSSRMSYKLAEKVSVTAAGGVEFRDYGQGGLTLDPIFSISGVYRLRANNGLALSASRKTTASGILVNQNYTSTGFNLDYYQSFLQALNGTVGVGYQFLDYQSTLGRLSTVRSDKSLIANAAMTWIMAPSLRTTLAYTYRNNSSSDNRLNIQGSTITLATSYLY